MRRTHDAAPLEIDGSAGEGGGQVVRTALALAVTLHRTVTITNIRVRRPRPGLRPQHLSAVHALAAVSDAVVEGATLDSTHLRFAPRTIRGGTYRFEVGTAGAVSLVLQTLLVPLAFAPAPSRLSLAGGTHVPWSPPFHHFAEVFLPAVAAMGVRVDATLRRWGWYPRGGGEVEVAITPTPPGALCGFLAETRDASLPLRALSAVSHLPRSIAERQRSRVTERLAAAGLTADVALEEAAAAVAAGTFVFLAYRGRAGFSALGHPGLPAEQVADAAVEPLLGYLASAAAVDEHLADQLVPLCALANRESSFTCPAVTSHLESVAGVVERFLPVRVRLAGGTPARVHIAPLG